MKDKKQKSFNHQVYQKAYKRLNLSSTQRIIFQRLLGFLIRNDKPFPFTAVSMSELTGFSLRTVFNVLNDLENYRLIKRHGMGKNRKFSAGTILLKIFATVQNRSNPRQNKNKTTVQPVHQKSINRATGAYNKTSLYLKHKDNDVFSKPTIEQIQDFHWHKKNNCLGIPDQLKWVEQWIDIYGIAQN